MSEGKPKIKEYTKGDITVVWQAGKCIHSEICFHGLSDVFDPKARPWVNVDGASSEQIVEQIKRCPSGALSFYKNDEKGSEQSSTNTELSIEVIPNGPLMVFGDLSLKHADDQISQELNKTALCRCGASGNKPYCDGSHKKVNFTG